MVPLVVILLVIGVIALVTGRIAGSAAAEGTASAAVGDLPRTAQGFPHGEQRYFAGVTVPRITEDWLANTPSGWTCEEETMDSLLNAEHGLVCQPDDEELAFLFDVRVDYDGEDQVAGLSARCDLGPEAKVCRLHFWNLCDAVFSGDPSTAKEAKQWVRQNMDSDLSAVFGDVHIWMPLEGTSAVIHAKPVG